MTWYAALKFLHILTVILFVGGLFARQLVRRAAKKADDIRLFAALSQAAGQIERILVIPGSQIALVVGVILALVAGYPILGFLQGASQNWLFVSNILLLGMIVIIPSIFLPRGKKFEPILQAALAEGRITPDLRTVMDDPVVRAAHLYEEISVIIIVALMVFKPF